MPLVVKHVCFGDTHEKVNIKIIWNVIIDIPVVMIFGYWNGILYGSQNTTTLHFVIFKTHNCTSSPASSVIKHLTYSNCIIEVLSNTYLTF
jgi:hypothetical protein